MIIEYSCTNVQIFEVPQNTYLIIWPVALLQTKVCIVFIVPCSKQAIIRYQCKILFFCKVRNLNMGIFPPLFFCPDCGQTAFFNTFLSVYLFIFMFIVPLNKHDSFTLSHNFDSSDELACITSTNTLFSFIFCYCHPKQIRSNWSVNRLRCFFRSSEPRKISAVPSGQPTKLGPSFMLSKRFLMRWKQIVDFNLLEIVNQKSVTRKWLKIYKILILYSFREIFSI